jgi:hypothetical protein
MISTSRIDLGGFLMHGVEFHRHMGIGVVQGQARGLRRITLVQVQED